MKAIKIDDKNYLVALDDMPGVRPLAKYNRGRVGLFGKPAGKVEVVDVAAVLDSVKAVEAELNTAFVGVAAPVHNRMLSLVSGDPLFSLSAPGTGKSKLAAMIGDTVANHFADLGIDPPHQPFWRDAFTPSKTMNQIAGALSIDAWRQGRVERVWAGIADSYIPLVDELFNGGQDIIFSILDTVEDRIMTTPEGSRRIPALTFFSASNSYSPESWAIWDRFTFREELPYPSRPDAIRSIFDAAADNHVMQSSLDPEALVLVQAWVEYSAKYDLPDNLKVTMTSIIMELRSVPRDVASNPIAVSPRRQQMWQRAVAAEAALTNGGVYDADALLVGSDILWRLTEEAPVVRKVIGGLASPARAFIMATRAEIEKWQSQIAEAADWGELTKLATRVKTADEQAARVLDDPKWDAERTEIRNAVGALNTAIYERNRDIMANQKAEAANG